MVLPKFHKLATKLRGFKKATKLQFWVLGTYFQIIIFSFLNNIVRIFIYFFIHIYFLKNWKLLFECMYQTPSTLTFYYSFKVINIYIYIYNFILSLLFFFFFFPPSLLSLLLLLFYPPPLTQNQDNWDRWQCGCAMEV